MGSVIDIDKGWNNIIAKLRNISSKEITVGIQADARSEDGKTNLARIAAVHEFGEDIRQKADTVDMYRRIKKNGAFANNGRLVKAKRANFMSTHKRRERVIHIPARPFLRPTFDEHVDDITGMARRAVAEVVAGGDGDKGLQRAGAYAQGLVQQKIRNGPFTPNKPATIKRKGSSRPLIDSRHMRQSVRYVIRPKGSSD